MTARRALQLMPGRRSPRQVVLVLVAVLGLAACVPDVATLQTRLAPHYRLQRPQGPGPFAALLLVPGCGGITAARLERAEELVRRGYLVVFVDYLSARGLETACRGEVSPGDVAGDIRATSAHLRSRPDVRSRAIGAVGWSLGGAGVLTTLVGAEMDRQPPVDAAVAFYPVCRGLHPWKINVPTLVLLAGRDDIAPPALCEDLIVRGAGRVEIRMYPEARHSFDMTDLPPPAPSRAFPGRTVGFDADAARRAWDDVLTHFEVRLPSRE